MDPHHIDADPDSDFYLMRIRMWIPIQILASKLRLKSFIHLACNLQIDADPDPAITLM